MHFKKGQAMKKRETETTEVTEETTGAGVIAPIVATVWCAVLIRVLMLVSKEEAE